MTTNTDDFYNVELRADLDAVKSATTKSLTTSERVSKSASQDAQTMAHDYEEVLQLIGFGKTQWIMLFIAGMLLMMVINETMGMSIINIASQCDFATTSVEKAIMSAASFIGILLSSYFWGYLSDMVGRRTILIYSTFGGNICSVISMFIPSFWFFVALRLVVGLLIAGASSLTYAYLGEFYEPRHRPVVINYASMFVGIAMAYVPAVAWLVLSMDWSLYISASFAFRPWRLLILFNLLPGFVAASVLMKLPESPKLLLALRRDDDAMAAVDWICMRNTGQHLSHFLVYKLKPEQKFITDNLLAPSKTGLAVFKRMWQDTRPLLRRPHVLNFLISCVIMCGLFLSSSGMGLWFSEIQNRVSQSDEDQTLTVCQVIDASMQQQENGNNNGTKVCDDNISTKSYIDSITFGLTYVVGYVLLGVILKALGRKVTMIGALCASALCGIALHWLLDPIAIVVSFCLFLTLPGLCISVLSGALVDLVPTHLRGKAVCICLMLGRGGSVIGSNIIGILLESYCSLTFYLFSGCVFVCAALTLILPI